MSRYPGMEIIEIKLEGWDCPKVEAYADEERRGLLLDPNKIVIQKEQIMIQFRYPLASPVYFSYTKKGGFTRMDLFRLIYEGYKKIYDEEDQEVGDLSAYEKLYNRCSSEGNYGIWGHFLEDLWLEYV